MFSFLLTPILTSLLTMGLALLLLMHGCASLSSPDEKSFYQQFEAGNYSKSLKQLDKIVNNKSYSNNKLLHLMHQGRLQFLLKKYQDSALTFHEAQMYFEKLYLKNNQENIYSLISNVNNIHFRGEFFELSMMYYYQTLSFFKLWQIFHSQGDQSSASFSVTQMKASLLNWNSFIESFQRSNPEKIFTHDLWQKLTAAQLHLMLNTSEQKNISLIHFQEAYKLITPYSLTLDSYYQNSDQVITFLIDEKESFFNQSNEFFDSWKKLDDENLVKPDLKKLKHYLLKNIYQLTKELRPQDINSFFTKYLVKKSDFEKSIKPIKPFNDHQNLPIAPVKIYFEDQIIQAKSDRKVQISLGQAVEKMPEGTTKSLVQNIGLPILTFFALGPLGLGLYQSNNQSSVFIHHNIGTTLLSEVGFEFYLPQIEQNLEEVSTNIRPEIILKNNETGEHHLLHDQAFIIHDLKSWLKINIEEDNASRFWERGIRLSTKYLIAILGAYSIYKSFGGKDNDADALAKMVALFSFWITSKGIAETEKSDLRSWNTLPNQIYLAEENLPLGSYSVFKVDKKSSKEEFFGTINVQNNDLNTFYF